MERMRYLLTGTRGSSSRGTAKTAYHAPMYNLPLPAEVRSCQWPCEVFIDGAGIRHEFEQFFERAGLTAFLADKCYQYQLLTNTFMQNFTFTPRRHVSRVSFHLYNQVFDITLAKFCKIWKIPYEGSIVDPRPGEFERFL